MKRPDIRDVDEISKNADRQLVRVTNRDLITMPYPYEDFVTPDSTDTEPGQACPACSLDGVSVLSLPEPKNAEEEQALVQQFLSGLKKLLSRDQNWTFLQPLKLSLDYCAKCLACSEACPVYVASGGQEIYRPVYRSEVLRRIISKYLGKGGKAFARFTEGDIDLNWATIARLAELSYRCTICRRCAQACVRGVDNGLIAHELRKLFSQEMGIAPAELHQLGTVRQLEMGTSTGMNPRAFKGIVSFMEDDIEEKTGRKISIPVDKEDADILLIHNSGEFLSWLENPEAFAIIFEAAGVDWTLSSELIEATNYGVWYDDIQLARIAMRHSEVARKLGVKRIVVGECGHAHKALMVVADRLFTEETYVPTESSIPLLEELVSSGRLNLDPARNDFPVTLHDPCNLVRLSGIVEPQRRILRAICPQFREMEPHGVDNYCCGGGSGFAIMNSQGFPEWKAAVAGRMKFRQILETFQDVISPDIHKYVCAPCSNCKGQLRDLFTYYEAGKRCGIFYGGLAELIANAMVDVEPFITWEEN